jgi:hypothetical protein
MDKMIEKIRALLALASDDGATEAEASLAAERAQELMLKHGIELAQIAMSEGQATKLGADSTRFKFDVKPWSVTLASGVARSVGGQIVVHENFRGVKADGSYGNLHGGVTFICPAGTTDMAVELFSWLHLQLQLISTTEMRNREEKWIHGRQWRRSWLTGASSRISERLRKAYDEARKSETTGSALVLMRDAVQDKRDELFPKLGRYAPSRNSLHSGAYNKGRDAGSSMDLGSPKIGNRRRQLAS